MNTTYVYYGGREDSKKLPIPSRFYQLPILALIFFIAFVGMTLPLTTWATITVSITTDEDTSNGDCSLREAIQSIEDSADYNGCTYDADNTISLAAGTYQLTVGPSITIDLAMTIEGADEATTIIERTTSHQVLIVDSAAVTTIKNITLKDGKSGTGGNVFVKSGSRLDLEDVTLTGGTSTANGGGLLNYGTTNLLRVTVDGNETTGTSGSGGGVYNAGNLTLDTTTISNNTTERKGGGIFNASAAVLIIQTNSSVEDNSSTLCGAGILTKGNNVTITSSTLQNNLYKSSSLSDLVTLSSYDLGANVTSSYVGAYINSCYKSTFLLIDDFVEDTTDTIDITADDLDDALDGADDAGGTLDLTVDDNLLDGYKERIKEELDNDLSADTRNTNDTTDAGSSDSDFEDAQDDLAALVSSVNNAGDDLGSIADANSAGGLSDDEVRALLEDSGLNNVVVDNDNEAEYVADIIAATSGNIDTTAELQDLVDQANLDVLSGYATGSDAGDLSIDQLNVDTLENVDSDNLALYQAAIADDTDGFTNWADLQDLIDEVNALALIQDYADANSASSLTTTQLTDAGVTDTVADNLDLYKDAIANADPADVDTLEELQALIDEVNALALLQDYADADDASSLTTTQLTDAGVTDTVADNLSLYKDAIANADPGDVDTLEELQALIDEVNALALIQDYADADSASSLTIDELTDTGVTGTNSSNLSLYKTAIANADPGDVDTLEELQALIDSVNDSTLETIQAYANAEDASAMTIAELEAGDIEGLDEDYLDDYKTAIAAAGIDSISSWEDVQAIIDQVNALKKIQQAADDDDASDITIDDLNEGGLADVDSGNLTEYQDEIEASSESDIQTWDDVQEIIDRVNEEVTSEEDTTTSSGKSDVPADHYQLTIASPHGRVTSSQKDIHGLAIDCNKGSGHCRGLFKRGLTVNLTATAPTGLLFHSWDGSPDCVDGKLIMNNARNCKALFYGDPNYIAPMDNDGSDDNVGDNADGTDGTDSNNSIYVDSFSIRAKIQGKNACYQHASPHPDDVVVAGFILEGAGTEQVLIRALDLEQGVNPKILVKQSVQGTDGILRGVPVAKNDAWELHEASLDIPEFHKPGNQTDAALLLNLGAGAYTVTMCMSPNSEADSGVGLVSIMLLDNTLTFGNVSGRGYISGGANDAIIGFSVYGTDGRQTAHIKGHALGESLDTQIDSLIEIGRIYFDPETNQVMGGRMANVSSWRDESSINHLPLHTELNETDAAISISFDPGSYTTILSSENGVPGLGIISIEFVD
ncbi:CSLREA domain-containing protein [Candidatus Albibeggiatoa sp. nov. BB20]|uniref:CSLREA domain-containing protein n=1 Tax=Candidatus Albibeggiatoa sp. nov. BB20 TaxID=3162723 RepID=UPI0033653A8F